MNKTSKYYGAVVPMVTPFTASGALDESALARVVDLLVAAGVAGIFVLGTTGEGAQVPREFRLRLVQQAVQRVNRRVLIYAGLGDTHPEGVEAGNDFLSAGVDVLVSRPPAGRALTKLEPWYRALLD